jgi:hypothetical protein
MSTIAASKLLNNNRWNKQVLRCLLANLRTTGRLGFREGSLKFPDDFTDGRGWKYYTNSDFIEYAPHYQAYLWAAYLWGYALTGHLEFYKKAKHAIRMTMEVYPDGWRWTNGLSQEIVRMLLPLSFLIRVENNEENRKWLDRITADVLELMQPSGAICELLGKPEKGVYSPPASNEEYGKKEASVIQKNGDTASDLLYTVNFAFLGLHEAAKATGDCKLQQAENKLAEFLCLLHIGSQRLFANKIPACSGYCFRYLIIKLYWHYYINRIKIITL